MQRETGKIGLKAIEDEKEEPEKEEPNVKLEKEKNLGQVQI